MFLQFFSVLHVHDVVVSNLSTCFKYMKYVFFFFFVTIIIIIYIHYRKNWTSSWTVLQGSTLLFAKGQGGGTSWVSDRNLLPLKAVVSYQNRATHCFVNIKGH